MELFKISADTHYATITSNNHICIVTSQPK